MIASVHRHRISLTHSLTHEKASKHFPASNNTAAYYKIVNKATQYVLEGNGRTLSLLPWKGPYQKWKFVSLEDGYYKIEHITTQYVLCGDGKNLYMLPWNESSCQRWKFISVDGGYYKIQKKGTECVVDGHRKEMPWSGGLLQQWKFEPVE